MAEFLGGALFMLIKTNPMVESSNFLWDMQALGSVKIKKIKINLFFQEPLNA
jgi:hypothetical protein